MPKTILWIPVGLCLITIAIFAFAQGAVKAGLWSVTTTQTWQQSPLPAGMQLPPGANSPFGGGPRTYQSCITPQMIEKYGGPVPQSRGDCKISNIAMKGNSVTADWICTGQMSGKGTYEASWTDDSHSRSKVHFTGTMQMGPNSRPIEWTSESVSVYKGPDCGSVQPMPMPSDK